MDTSCSVPHVRADGTADAYSSSRSLRRMKSLRLGGSGSAAVFLAMSKPSSRLSWRRHCRRSDRTAPSPSSSPGATAVGGPPVRPHALTHLQRNVGYFRFVRTSRRSAICASVTTGSRADRRRADRDAVSRAGWSRDDNGSAGHGSRVKWVNKYEWVTWVTGQ